MAVRVQVQVHTGLVTPQPLTRKGVAIHPQRVLVLGSTAPEAVEGLSFPQPHGTKVQDKALAQSAAGHRSWDEARPVRQSPVRE